MATVTVLSDFGAQESEIWHCFHVFPICFSWSDRTRCHDLCFWMLSFKPAFLLFSFSFIKKLVSSSSLSAIKVVSSTYLRLLIFLPAILIPACASSSLGFQMIHSAFKLNKQASSIMLKRSDESRHPSVVPCLRAKVSCHSQWCLLCIFLKCSLSYSGSSYLLLVCWICLTWNSVRFARCFFCICCHKHMSFVFYTVDMIYNISWFWDVKPILHSWD